MSTGQSFSRCAFLSIVLIVCLGIYLHYVSSHNTDKVEILKTQASESGGSVIETHNTNEDSVHETDGREGMWEDLTEMVSRSEYEKIISSANEKMLIFKWLKKVASLLDEKCSKLKGLFIPLDSEMIATLKELKISETLKASYVDEVASKIIETVVAVEEEKFDSDIISMVLLLLALSLLILVLFCYLIIKNLSRLCCDKTKFLKDGSVPDQEIKLMSSNTEDVSPIKVTATYDCLKQSSQNKSGCPVYKNSTDIESSSEIKQSKIEDSNQKIEVSNQKIDSYPKIEDSNPKIDDSNPKIEDSNLTIEDCNEKSNKSNTESASKDIIFVTTSSDCNVSSSNDLIEVGDCSEASETDEFEVIHETFLNEDGAICVKETATNIECVPSETEKLA